MKQFFVKQWRYHKQRLFVVIVAAILLVGFVQAAIGYSYVLKLAPIMLTLVVCLAVIFWEAPIKAKLSASAIIVVGSYVLEVIGVQTGLLFGNYSFGKLLGFTIFGVPLTIGLIWLLVSLSAWNIVLYSKTSLLQKFLIGGVLVLMFDLIQEQFAATYSFWSWRAGTEPLYNYVCWFGVSLICFFVLHKLTPKMQPSLFAAYILPLLASFFWLMLIIA